MPEVFWCPLPREVVLVEGPDAHTYLHSQTSQDLMPLGVGESTWTFLLEPTGKVDVLARVLRRDAQAFVFDVDAGFGDRLVARLTRFKIRVKADVSRLSWSCIAVRGVAAVEPAPETDGAHVVTAGGIELVHGFDLFGPAPTPPAGVREGTPDELERTRVAAAWPAMGAEIHDDTIPSETGVLDAAVSFTKGCYPGQELVERMDSRGAGAPRRLVPVTVAEGTAVGAPVLVDGADVGTITSVAGDVAIASVKRSVADERVPGLRTVGRSEYRRDADDPA